MQAAPALASFLVALVGLVAANLMPFMLIGLTSQFELSVTTAGAIMTASLLATAAVAVTTLKLVSGPRRRLVAQLGLIAAAVGYGVAAVSPAIWLTTTAVILAGAGAGASVSAGGAALAIFKNASRVMGLNLLFNRTTIAIILAVIPLISLSSITAFGSAALISLLALLTTAWLPTALAPEQADLGAQEPMVSPASSRKVTLAGIALLALFPIWALTEDSVWAIAGTMGIEQAAASEELLGMILSVSTVGGLLGALLIVAVGNRYGRAVPIALFVLIGIVLKIVLTATTDPVLYTITLVGGNFIYSILFALIIATAAGLDASGKWSGPTLGIYLLGSAFAPVFATALVEAIGYLNYGIVIAVINLCLLVPFFVIARLSTKIEYAPTTVNPTLQVIQN